MKKINRIHNLLLVTLLALLLIPQSADAYTLISHERGAAGQHKGHYLDRHINPYGLRTDRYDGEHHLFGFYTDLGYSCYLNNVENYFIKPGGYTAGLGFTYAYHRGRFIVQTGVGARWQTCKDSVADWTYTRDDYDTQYTKFRLTYDFWSRYDVSRNLYVEVPLYIGTYWGNWYGLIGPRFRMQVWGNTCASAIGSTTAEYERYIGICEQMDNHGIRRAVPVDYRSNALNFGFDLGFDAEIGYEWMIIDVGDKSYMRQEKRDRRVRLALFADAGLLNITPHKGEKLYMIPEATRYDFQTYALNHTFNTGTAYKAQIHNLFVGVRFTYFFYGIQSKQKCLFCSSGGRGKPL